MKIFLTCSIALAIATACTPSPATNEIPFAAKKGETDFLQKCIKDSLPCVWYYWKQASAGVDPIVTTTYAFKNDALASGFSAYSTCSESKLISATVYRNGKKQEYARQTLPRNEDLCQLVIPPASRSGSGDTITFLRIVQSISLTSDLQGYQLRRMYFPKGATVKVAVFSQASIFLETDLPGVPYRKEIGHGKGIIEAFKSVPRMRYLALSTHPDWASFSALFRSVWDKQIKTFNIPESIFQGSGSALQKSLAAFRRLNLKYETNAKLSFVQHRKLDDILKSGVGDCKDFTMLMSAILQHEGIRSEPVAVRLDGDSIGPPMMKFLPDALWPNHQLLYLPDSNQYLDPTLDGNMFVDERHGAFNTVGINLHTGKRVIVGQ